MAGLFVILRHGPQLMGSDLLQLGHDYPGCLLGQSIFELCCILALADGDVVTGVDGS